MAGQQQAGGLMARWHTAWRVDMWHVEKVRCYRGYHLQYSHFEQQPIGMILRIGSLCCLLCCSSSTRPRSGWCGPAQCSLW